jgi:hypothetical protein
MYEEGARKEHLTLDQLVHIMQKGWIRFRNAQLHAFCTAAPVLTWAREREADFLTYCRQNAIIGDTPETRVVELMLADDGDGGSILRERRAEYGACIGWFADPELCPHSDPDEAVALAQNRGRITGIAKEYRDKKDAENPKAKAAKSKGQASKRARRQGSENNVSGGASAAAALAFAEEMDSQATIIPRTREPGHDFCAADGNSDAMLAFMSRHGISVGIKQELDDGNHVQIYLRVWSSTEKQFQFFGPALDPDLADNLADIIVREHDERTPKVAEAA